MYGLPKGYGASLYLRVDLGTSAKPPRHLGPDVCYGMSVWLFG